MIAKVSFQFLALCFGVIMIASAKMANAQTTAIPIASSTTDRNGTASVTLTGLPTASSTDATISLDVFADLNRNAGQTGRKFLEISVDGVVVDTVTLIRSCRNANPNRVVNRMITIPQATLAPLITDGEIVVSYRAGRNVRARCASHLGVAAGAAFGAQGTITYAGVVVTPNAGTVIATPNEESIARFLDNRARALVQNQPDVVRFVDGRAAGYLNAEVTRGTGDLSFSSSARNPIWASLQASWTDGSFGDQSYILGSVGAHKHLGGNAVIGAMLQFDISKREETGIADTEGTGWLIGPYVATQIGRHPLYFDARLLYGQTDNEITPTGAPKDQFDGERWLAMIGLEGAVETNSMTIFPGIDISHVNDKQDAYIDSTATLNPSQSVEQTEIALGLDFEAPLAGMEDKVTLTWGGSGIWSKTSGSGPSATVVRFDDGWRGRFDLGYRYDNGKGITSDANAFVDGIGGDQDTYGLSVTLNFEF